MKIYTLKELEEIKNKVKCECWKRKFDEDFCKLGNVEMYEHDGGDFVEGHKEKQWIYFTCKVCSYQWSLTKILRRLKNQEIEDKEKKMNNEYFKGEILQ